MPDLNFQVESAEAVPYAASPQLAFKLRITQSPDEPPEAIHSVMLRCQIRLEPGRRKYSAGEEEGLNELFGQPHRWGQTVRSMLWTNAVLLVPPFTGQTVADLPILCTYDFNIATTKYFNALQDGEIPLCLLFSGTIFYAGADGALQVEQISWEKEANFRLPVKVWKQMMEMYYPKTAWLSLNEETFQRLNRFKQQCALPTWEHAFDALLDQAQTAARAGGSP